MRDFFSEEAWWDGFSFRCLVGSGGKLLRCESHPDAVGSEIAELCWDQRSTQSVLTAYKQAYCYESTVGGVSATIRLASGEPRTVLMRFDWLALGVVQVEAFRELPGIVEGDAEMLLAMMRRRGKVGAVAKDLGWAYSTVTRRMREIRETMGADSNCEVLLVMSLAGVFQ